MHDCLWTVCADGLFLQSSDNSNSVLVQVVFRTRGFRRFQADKELKLGVKAKSFHEALKHVNKDYSLILKCDDNSDDISLHTFCTNGGPSATFDLHLIDFDRDEVEIPIFDVSCKVSMPTSCFVDVCKQFSTVGDTVTISVKSDFILFESDGNCESGRIKVANYSDIRFPSDSINIDVVKQLQQTYSTCYFRRLLKIAPLANRVDIHIVEELPIAVVFQIDEYSALKTFIAPRL
ncbi:Oidioi.mRNA.OKI2018_I69.PAR.g8533.t1.cds [Oikopleura dioica]|uniref:DNA sliding clamp PCNA n=1 Tax=Oikopleura dioica TaxID=34765 RepID=A0ABN7RGF3_OIKDI|nr:Oidioi.mRNA.OKI2018_I69.PAR.g8533.t1.cds [Oikopleura dioica]